MTLLVALKGKDGLVLAADSRGTFGDPRGVTAQNDSQKKAHILAKHVAVLAAGAGEIGINVVRDAEGLIGNQPVDGVTPVMSLLRQTARQRYQDWFPQLPPMLPPGMPGIARPDVLFIVAGYDQDAEGEFRQERIFSLGSGLDFPPALHEYGFALGGIGQYALYLLNRLYEADRTLEELKALAVYTISETASQDGKVGGPIRVVTITPKDGCDELSGADVERIVTRNVGRSKALKNSFFTRRDRR